MARKVVIGVGIATHPVAAGGNSWLFLQWVLGFRDLGRILEYVPVEGER